MGLLPLSVMLKLMPALSPIVDFRVVSSQVYKSLLHPICLPTHFTQSITSQVAAILQGSNVKSTDVAHPTIFHDIIDSKLPDSDKSLERLTEEALSVVGAGMETTKWVLTVATFHLLSNDDVRAKLKSELAEAMPDSANILPYNELEKLAFLTAVIQECKSTFN